METRPLESCRNLPQSAMPKVRLSDGKLWIDMGGSKNRGFSLKMDGENNGKPYFLKDDLGGNTPIFWVQHPH